MSLTVILDNGHGGVINGKYVTPGKRGFILDTGIQLFEGVFNRSIVNKVFNILQPMENINPRILVPEQEDIKLHERVNRANEIHDGEPDNRTILISIHANAWKTNRACGIETYYWQHDNNFSKKGKDLARLFHTNLKGLLLTDRGVKSANFYILRHTTMPSILLELGFMTNSYDCKYIATEKTQDDMALMIATQCTLLSLHPDRIKSK